MHINIYRRLELVYFPPLEQLVDVRLHHSQEFVQETHCSSLDMDLSVLSTDSQIEYFQLQWIYQSPVLYLLRKSNQRSIINKKEIPLNEFIQIILN